MSLVSSSCVGALSLCSTVGRGTVVGLISMLLLPYQDRICFAKPFRLPGDRFAS